MIRRTRKVMLRVVYSIKITAPNCSTETIASLWGSKTLARHVKYRSGTSFILWSLLQDSDRLLNTRKYWIRYPGLEHLIRSVDCLAEKLLREGAGSIMFLTYCLHHWQGGHIVPYISWYLPCYRKAMESIRIVCLCYCSRCFALETTPAYYNSPPTKRQHSCAAEFPERCCRTMMEPSRKQKHVAIRSAYYAELCIIIIRRRR